MRDPARAICRAGDAGMIKKSSLGAFVAACGMAVLLAACSGSGSSDEVVAGESVYDPGASMAAVGFDEACEIGRCIAWSLDTLPPSRQDNCSTGDNCSTSD